MPSIGCPCGFDVIYTRMDWEAVQAQTARKMIFCAFLTGMETHIDFETEFDPRPERISHPTGTKSPRLKKVYVCKRKMTNFCYELHNKKKLQITINATKEDSFKIILKIQMHNIW